MHRLWLIGLREFKAYVATFSFWTALAVGPVLMLIAAGLLAATSGPPIPLRIVVVAPDAALSADASAALADLDDLLGRPVMIADEGQTRVRLTRTDTGVAAKIDGEPLAEPVRRVFQAELSRRMALRALGGAGVSETPVRLEKAPPAAKADPEAGARFGLVFMLWLTLTGSLGMLLQAVVRERANRALDSLMAAAQPVEIVFGKLLGVGAVSLLVLTAWVGTASALGGLMPPAATGPLSGVMGALGDPMLIAQAAGLYVLTYVMYGSVTIALGARAQDVASAQNLSRPMFGVLLVAFFAALASAMGMIQTLSWMIWAPPLTPFMLLLTPTASLTMGVRLAALGLTALAALGCGWIAARSLAAPSTKAVFRRDVSARAG
jgi:ABC-2 type transport system permease protein